MAGGSAGRGGPSLEFTPTWVAALVCTVIVSLSLAVEKVFHLLSRRLKRMNRRFLYKALQKLKEEIMLMGLISLLLARLQDEIVKLCIPVSWASKGLPCQFKKDAITDSNSTISHFQMNIGSHLLAEETHSSYCLQKGKVPLLSYHALHDLHILIFVLAVVHVVVCALTVLFGAAKISQWKRWEESILHNIQEVDDGEKIIHVEHEDFIKSRYMGTQAKKRIWLSSFVKHLWGPVTKSDYAAMRAGFVLTHCRGKTKFNFCEYMTLAFESDFKEVVSISWCVWLIVIISLLLNLSGWHVYLWIAFLPLIILLVVGTKLEQVITLLATEVAQRQSDGVVDLEIHPSDNYFWFNKPKVALSLIRIILSCNAFAIAFFFWKYSRYGYNGCSMDSVVFTIPRFVIVIFVQVLCSYSTLPLYAIVTQMGSSYHREAMKICGYLSLRVPNQEQEGSGSTDLAVEMAHSEDNEQLKH